MDCLDLPRSALVQTHTAIRLLTFERLHLRRDACPGPHGKHVPGSLRASSSAVRSAFRTMRELLPPAMQKLPLLGFIDFSPRTSNDLWAEGFSPFSTRQPEELCGLDLRKYFWPSTSVALTSKRALIDSSALSSRPSKSRGFLACCPWY